MGFVSIFPKSITTKLRGMEKDVALEEAQKIINYCSEFSHARYSSRHILRVYKRRHYRQWRCPLVAGKTGLQMTSLWNYLRDRQERESEVPFEPRPSG